MLEGQSAIVVVAPLSVLLGGLEQLFGLFGILFHHRSIAHFALEEVDELVPLGLLAVKGERVFAFGFEGGVVTSQVPVTTFDSAGLFLL